MIPPLIRATQAVLNRVETRLRAAPFSGGDRGGRSRIFVVVDRWSRHEPNLDDVTVLVELEAVRDRRRGPVCFCMASPAKRLEVMLIERDERVVYVARRKVSLVVDDHARRTAPYTKPRVPLEDICSRAPPRGRLVKGFRKGPHI